MSKEATRTIEAQVVVRDTSTITVPIGASAAQMVAVLEVLTREGEYELNLATVVEEGQRDPYAVAVRLTFVKEQVT